MDFHSFTRKALQALCKQNGIPANITNVAMADSLTALPHVEGLQELLSQSPEKSRNVLRTAAKTAIRRKVEPESSQPMASTTARRASVAPKKAAVVNEEAEDQEMMMTEVPPKTPAAAPSMRRRAAASARQSLEIPTETMTSVQGAYSTRRSVRLLGKTMSKMSLDKESESVTSSIEELFVDTINCSEQSESSVVKGSDMQTVSDMDMSSKGIDASEVSSEHKSVGDVVDVSMPKSEVSASKLVSAVDVISEAMDEAIEESSVEANKTANDDKEGAQDLVAAKESEDVTDVKTVKPIKVTLSVTPTKSLDMNVEAPKAEALADYSGKFDFEEEESEDESTEDEAVNAPMEASEDEQESDDDSTEGEASSEDDDESDEEEEESDDDITEVESSEDEAVASDKSEVVAVVTQTSSSSPLPNIATQFPRPSSAKSSAKKQPKIAMCFDTSSNEVNKEEKNEVVEKYKAKSLRQLKKMVKKMAANNNSEEEPRVALKEVSENTMAVI